eukprot:354887-Chlamydomonas_euryale.AAC.12
MHFLTLTSASAVWDTTPSHTCSPTCYPALGCQALQPSTPDGRHYVWGPAPGHPQSPAPNPPHLSLAGRLGSTTANVSCAAIPLQLPPPPPRGWTATPPPAASNSASFSASSGGSGSPTTATRTPANAPLARRAPAALTPADAAAAFATRARQ